jgi:lipoprotein-anchoring transpeptidase ErfK/SrfK
VLQLLHILRMVVPMKNPVLGLLGAPAIIVAIFGLYTAFYGTSTTASPYVLVPLPAPIATTTDNRTATSSDTVTIGPLINQPQALVPYLEITKGCRLAVDDTCARAYREATTSAAAQASLRIGTVLAVKNTITTDTGEVWHEIHFPETLRYSDRLSLPWFVPTTAGTIIRTAAPADLVSNTATTSKRIVVDRGDQILYAYESNELVRMLTISTGRELTPTPRGTFTIYRKTPSRYMQGPIAGISTNYYDLPGVPWNLYFTKQGAVIHGAYWHDDFGNQHSNGCVNLDPIEARELYDWAELGTTVTVQD